MKPEMKRVKVWKEHCPNCGEMLRGNNSIATPWVCACGEWAAVPKYPWNGEYEIMKRTAPKEPHADE